MNMQRLTLWVAATWNTIRSLATDDAYDKYLAHHAQAHAGSPPMSRRAFYLQQQQSKWTGVSRCC
ncbi:YbdD/YjiX family protein [Steroidobacter sp. S1-65]|uniref:YbdD/YjiX family protein n=1 Tax=Steroidobacter gossypii TaxID=2805490 RepID=A0ABS1WRS8_9GAMM|nr:YbdD/YjiX family protein [Steroidobacter gossypii]MBM0103683.1 YbdD/YjiX family protein [Steroidobacter gossypii]